MPKLPEDNLKASFLANETRKTEMLVGTEEGPISYQSVYQELRGRAQYFLRGERRGHTLRPTEVVHEAWMRMTSVDINVLESRQDFMALAGTIMRNLLVDYARTRNAQRRGGGCARADLPTQMPFCDENIGSILQVNNLLERLAEMDERAAEVVKLRFFMGLTEDEVATALSVSPRTVKRDWDFAKRWMREQLTHTNA